jgi:SPP1 gp7 family putative phage head morphogenesis protein
MSQKTVTDAMIRHQIFIGRYAGSVNREAQQELQRVMDLIIVEIMNDNLTTGRLRWLEALFEQVSLIANGGAQELVPREGEWSANMLTAAGVDDVQPLPPAALLAAYNNTPMELVSGDNTESLTPNQMTRRYDSAQATAVMNIVRDGQLTGKTNSEIVSEVQLLGRNKSRNDTEALVRTLTNQAANESRKQTFIENGIENEEYTSVLDGRTTITCASLSGNIYPVGQGPYPPRHYRCRSLRIAIIGSVEPNVGTYENWLKRQPKSVQNEVLGPERAELFRSGELTVDKFTDDRGVVYTIEELEQINDIEIN